VSGVVPSVVQTMIDQLGGRRIFAMAFASCVYDTVDITADRPVDQGVAGLSLRIAPALVKNVKGRATHVVVTLGHNDLYTVKAIRCRAGVQTVTAEFDMVYGDQLRTVTESATGLTLTLGAS